LAFVLLTYLARSDSSLQFVVDANPCKWNHFETVQIAIEKFTAPVNLWNPLGTAKVMQSKTQLNDFIQLKQAYVVYFL